MVGDLGNFARIAENSPWQSGSKGLNWMYRACRPNLSARLCASLQTYGERNLFLLETRVGSSERKRADAIKNVKAHKTVRSWTVNLSKTAGADGSQGRTLNPLRRGQHRRGSDPSLRTERSAPIWFEPRRPDRSRDAVSGGRLLKRRPVLVRYA